MKTQDKTEPAAKVQSDDEHLISIFAMLFALGVNKARDGRSGLAAMRAGLEMVFQSYVDGDLLTEFFRAVTTKHRPEMFPDSEGSLARFALNASGVMRTLNRSDRAGIAQSIKSGELYAAPELPDGYDGWLGDAGFSMRGGHQEYLFTLRHYMLFDGFDDERFYYGYLSSDAEKVDAILEQHPEPPEARTRPVDRYRTIREKLREMGVEGVLSDEESEAEQQSLRDQFSHVNP